MNRKGVAKKQKIHRLVATTWIPKTEEDIRLGRNVVNHKNHIRDDNRVENLEWVTNQENDIDSCRFGTRGGKITYEMHLDMVNKYDTPTEEYPVGMTAQQLHDKFYP